MAKVEEFFKAAMVFSNLVNKEVNKGRKIGKEFYVSEKEINKSMGIAALAVATLRSMDEEYLQQLEKDRIIPQRAILTILGYAEHHLYDYFFDDIKKFNSGDYEERERVCGAVFILYQQKIPFVRKPSILS